MLQLTMRKILLYASLICPCSFDQFVAGKEIIYISEAEYDYFISHDGIPLIDGFALIYEPVETKPSAWSTLDDEEDD